MATCRPRFAARHSQAWKMNRAVNRQHVIPAPEFTRTPLFSSDTAFIADVRCRGECRHRSAEEHTAEAQLIFPYHGMFIRHLGSAASVADANQVLFFGADEVHQVSHPVTGGDSCIVMTLPESVLSELAGTEFYDEKNRRFRTRERNLEPSAQALRSVLLRRLIANASSTLEAESISLALASMAFASLPRTQHRPTLSKRHLINRVKLFLAESMSKKISLSEIGSNVGASPVYLTQIFSELEGVPLYRYHLRLRLAQTLLRLPEQKDLSALAQDLGFSSHSQFTTVFGQTFGLSPRAFMQQAGREDIRELLKILKAVPTST
jgi:AraC-like DNA-binding protein